MCTSETIRPVLRIVRRFRKYNSRRGSTKDELRASGPVSQPFGKCMLFLIHAVNQTALSKPFERFEGMHMLCHKALGGIQVDESVWKKLPQEKKQEIERICNEKLEQYYQRMKMN